MIKLTDYIVKTLENYGITNVFMITGGGAMHLNDSFGRSKKIKTIFNHHEQACAIGAEGYSRVTGKLSVVNITSGPGGLNTLTGVMGQWTDSIPVLFLSGQVKQETTIEICRDLGLRQLGDQEINIIDIVKPITKYSAIIKDPFKIKWHLEKAIFIATHGRPGPVWLDIPLDVQATFVDEEKLQKYDSKEDSVDFNKQEIIKKVKIIVEKLKSSKRPVIIAGHGIRISNAIKSFFKLIDLLKIPVLSSFNGFDIVPSSHPLYIGRIGTIGDRAGNFTLQNSDLILSIGSRNNIRQVSYNWKDFGKKAYKVSVDIDSAELNKPTFQPDLKIEADAQIFIDELVNELKKIKLNNYINWVKWCKERKLKYPVVIDEYYKTDKINPYYFIQKLTEALKEEAIIIAGNGSACVTLFQAGIVKKNQRIFWNSGCAQMGYDLPASIGACFAKNKQEVICIAGDGSLQMNIQELVTVSYNKLPIKIFYLNNDGYISIRQTQTNFFNGRLHGTDPQSGVGFPDIIKVAKAYNFKTYKIISPKKIKNTIDKVLKTDGPVLCEIILDNNYIFSPKVSSQKLPDGKIVSKPLEDMYPFLERNEYDKAIKFDFN
jgi:acetolactate synthase I/II/III large subunit